MMRNLVHASRSKSVRTVVIDGRVVLEDGVYPHLDEPAMLAHIDAAAQRLLRAHGGGRDERTHRPSGRSASSEREPRGDGEEEPLSM